MGYMTRKMLELIWKMFGADHILWSRSTKISQDLWPAERPLIQREGGKTNGGNKQMRANKNKCRQTLTTANTCGGENASKHKQEGANVDKRTPTLTPPFLLFLIRR